MTDEEMAAAVLGGLSGIRAFAVVNGIWISDGKRVTFWTREGDPVSLGRVGNGNREIIELNALLSRGLIEEVAVPAWWRPK